MANNVSAMPTNNAEGHTQQSNINDEMDIQFERGAMHFMSPPSTSARAWTTLRQREQENEFTSEAYFDVSGIKIGVDFAIVDAGATRHFLVPDAPIDDVRVSKEPLAIHMPQGGIIKSTYKGTLRLPWLPKKAQEAHGVPGLAHSSLVSIKVLCKVECKVIYKVDTVKVHYKGELVCVSVLASGRWGKATVSPQSSGISLTSTRTLNGWHYPGVEPTAGEHLVVDLLSP
jgi:hypothetical protein